MKTLSVRLYTATLLAIAWCIAGCSKHGEPIAHAADYEQYLHRTQNVALDNCNEELRFWQTQLHQVPTSETYRIKIAGLLATRFMLAGNIADMAASDSLYRSLIAGTTQQYASLHRALATNSITQHRFKEAHRQIHKALAIGENKAASLYQLVDVSIELGDIAGARHAMHQLADKNVFPYLIREAKLKDHAGNLDSAVVLMEQALAKVHDNPTLQLWTLTNLADMYGHAGRIDEAYQHYLRALALDPDNDYALKGIAWITFSHDGNTAGAKRIAQAIQHRRATPDIDLLLAQIAEAEHDTITQQRHLRQFKAAASNPRYGDMYNKYLALLDADHFGDTAAALSIALREVNNRPTAQSFDLLAWSHLRAGRKKEALAIAQDKIEHRTFEPEIIFHLAMIYEANGINNKAQHYFALASDSNFELGPLVAQQIARHQ